MFDFLLIGQGVIFGQTLKEAAAVRGLKLFDHQGSWEEGIQFFHELSPKCIVVSAQLLDDLKSLQLIELIKGSDIPVALLIENNTQVVGELDQLPLNWIKFPLPVSPLALIDTLAREHMKQVK